MTELTQPATVLSITDLTPHVSQLLLLPKTQKIVFHQVSGSPYSYR